MFTIRSLAVALCVHAAASLAIPGVDDLAVDKTGSPEITFKRADAVKPLTKCPGGGVELELINGSAKLLDPKTRQQVGTTLAHNRVKRDGSNSIITCWAFSPDGKLVATGSRCYNREASEGQICIWEVATGKRLAEYTGDKQVRQPIGNVQGVAFSEDGKAILFLARKFEVDSP